MNVDEIKLRPESPDDEAFLRAVYASTREEELAAVGWPPAMRDSFLAMQFAAQTRGYRGSYPNADFQIILKSDKAVGRMVVQRSSEEILLVDIALLTTERGRGVGSVLLKELLAESTVVRKPLRLHVIKGSRAVSFYRGLGFKRIGELEIRNYMEWRPPIPPST